MGNIKLSFNGIYNIKFSLFNIKSEYQQANMDVRILQSATCRIEDIITEENRSNKSEAAITTLVESYFLLKLIHSNNTYDQFRLSEVPLLHEPGQDIVW